MINRGYEQYRQVQVQTAAPGDLILLLYNGAIKFLNRASIAIEDQDVQAAHTNLIKAQNIVLELNHALDMTASSITVNLNRLYDYMYRRLVYANIHKDAAAVAEVTGLLRDLLTAWEQAVQTSQSTLKGLAVPADTPAPSLPAAPPTGYKPWSRTG